MKRVLGALLLVVGLVATATTGSAAQLAVAAGSLSASAVTHPCPGPDAVVMPAGPTGAANTFTGATVSLPTGCDGSTVQLVLLDGATVVASGSGPVAGTTATVTTTGAYVAATGLTVLATVSGWNLPAEWPWTAPPTATTNPITSGNADTVVVVGPFEVIGWHRFCVPITVDSTSDATWRLRLDLNQRPFNGVSPTALEMPGWVKIEPPGVVDGIVHLVRSGAVGSRAESFTLCATTPPPVYDPSLGYGTTTGPVTGSSAQACVSTTVSVVGTPQFYAGWRADVDMNAAIALAATSPDTFTGVSALGGPYLLESLGGGVWRASGAGVPPPGANTHGIRDDSPRTVTLCAS